MCSGGIAQALAPRVSMGTYEISRSGRTIEVRVPDVHIVDAFPREARSDLLALLLDVEYDRHEALETGRRHIVLVRPLNERLALQV